MIERYVHHEGHGEVAVQTHLRGRHREHCLCWQGCRKFKPGEKDNCEIAQAVFRNCVDFNLVTPVWECPEFEE